MDAVIQVEVVQLRTVVTEAIVVLIVGTDSTLTISTWITVYVRNIINNVINRNAPNRFLISV
jgi:hypothetical protein